MHQFLNESHVILPAQTVKPAQNVGNVLVNFAECKNAPRCRFKGRFRIALNYQNAFAAAAVRRLDHKFFVSFNHLQQVLDLILHFNHADEVRGGNADFLRQNLGLYFVVHQRIKAAVVALGNNAEIPPVHAQNAGFPKRGGRGEIFQPAETKHCSAFLCQR